MSQHDGSRPGEASAPWGGRFADSMAAAMNAYTESLTIDHRLIAADLWGNVAHALMLHQVGLLRDDEAAKILTGLGLAQEAHEAGEFQLKPELEDVHMNVERYVTDHAGPEYGGKLHTARSRNDQVLTDCRLYVREQLLTCESALLDLAAAMLAQARAHLETVMPGYTHSQHAQPITFGFWASAHVSAWLRDLRRLRAAYGNVNRSPLGACALAGTDLPIDRALTASLMGFEAVEEHALDATSSRDFLAETLAALTLLMIGLSRLSEELVWWSSYEFRLVELSDAYTSGSSIMPQKKNPDCAELTRGKTARVIGDLMALLGCLKSVSFGYSRDLQEDKPPVWDAFDQVMGALGTLTGAVSTMSVNVARMSELVAANFANATQLANWLVKEHRVPFRTAHEIVGSLVGQLSPEGRTLADGATVVAHLAAHGVVANAEQVAAVVDPLAGVARQASLGGPAPHETRRMVDGFDRAVAAGRDDVAERYRQVTQARRQTFEQAAQVIRGEAR